MRSNNFRAIASEPRLLSSAFLSVPRSKTASEPEEAGTRTHTYQDERKGALEHPGPHARETEG